MDITPDFAAIALDWLEDARTIADEHGPHTAHALLVHDAWGQLLIQHGWITPDGQRATGQGTIASPAEVLATIRES